MCRNRTDAKEDEKKHGAGDARPCAPGCTPPPVVPSVWRGPGTSRTMRFELLWTPGFALDFHVLGLLGLLFNLSSLGLASTHIFLLKIGPDHANLQSQLSKAKTNVIGEIHAKILNKCKLIPNCKPKSPKISMQILHLSNSPTLSLLLVLKQNNKQNKQGTCIYGL